MNDDAGGKSALSEGLGLLPKPDVFDPGRFGVAWGEAKVLAYAAAAVAAECERCANVVRYWLAGYAVPTHVSSHEARCLAHIIDGRPAPVGPNGSLERR